MLGAFITHSMTNSPHKKKAKKKKKKKKKQQQQQKHAGVIKNVHFLHRRNFNAWHSNANRVFAVRYTQTRCPFCGHCFKSVTVFPTTGETLSCIIHQSLCSLVIYCSDSSQPLFFSFFSSSSSSSSFHWGDGVGDIETIGASKHW